jgi:membrane protein DedA with SNARE-associated domain
LLPTATASHPAAAELLGQLWAYLTLAATGIITEEATPLIGGLAAHDGRLHLSLVIMWVTGGTWVADLGLYYVGRWRGRWVRRRWPAIRTFMYRALKIVRRHPWRSSVAVRWAYGLRLTLPIACGAARIPLWLYAIGSAVSCITWSAFFTILGWGFGRATLRMLGHVRRYEKYLVAGIILALLVVFWVMRKRHVEDEVVEVLATGDTGPIPRVSHDTDDERMSE